MGRWSISTASACRSTPAAARCCGSPAVDVVAFEATSEPKEVHRFSAVAVTAVAVHHEPVLPAVAYRFDGP